jgi:hypothetical protein
MNTIVPLAAEAAEEAVEPWVWGVGTLVALLALLVVTLVFGWGRPHT